MTSQGQITPGSFYLLRRKCGKATCRCARGQLHAVWVLTRSEAGKHKLYTVPPEQRAALRRIAGHQRLEPAIGARQVALRHEAVGHRLGHVLRGAPGGPLRELGHRVVALQLDVTNGAQIAAAAKAAPDVQLLVNNAGVAAMMGADFTDPQWIAAGRQEMDVNYFGTFAITQAFAPVLKRNGGGAMSPGCTPRCAGPSTRSR